MAFGKHWGVVTTPIGSSRIKPTLTTYSVTVVYLDEAIAI